MMRATNFQHKRNQRKLKRKTRFRKKPCTRRRIGRSGKRRKRGSRSRKKSRKSRRQENTKASRDVLNARNAAIIFIIWSMKNIVFWVIMLQLFTILLIQLARNEAAERELKTQNSKHNYDLLQNFDFDEHTQLDQCVDNCRRFVDLHESFKGVYSDFLFKKKQYEMSNLSSDS